MDINHKAFEHKPQPTKLRVTANLHWKQNTKHHSTYQCVLWYSPAVYYSLCDGGAACRLHDVRVRKQLLIHTPATCQLLLLQFLFFNFPIFSTVGFLISFSFLFLTVRYSVSEWFVCVCVIAIEIVCTRMSDINERNLLFNFTYFLCGLRDFCRVLLIFLWSSELCVVSLSYIHKPARTQIHPADQTHHHRTCVWMLNIAFMFDFKRFVTAETRTRDGAM